MSELTDLPEDALEWRAASKSGGGSCVEVARCGDLVAVRDSKSPARGFLTYTPYEWECFLDGARKGEFDDLAKP